MLLKVQSRLEADDREATLVPLLHLITSYTLYRNVLTKLRKAVYMADLGPAIFEAGPIGDAWKILKETTETRWEILKDYMASGRELTKCSYPAVSSHHDSQDPSLIQSYSVRTRMSAQSGRSDVARVAASSIVLLERVSETGLA